MNVDSRAPERGPGYADHGGEQTGEQRGFGEPYARWRTIVARCWSRSPRKAGRCCARTTLFHHQMIDEALADLTEEGGAQFAGAPQEGEGLASTRRREEFADLQGRRERSRSSPSHTKRLPVALK